jgi:sRNA-binding carbon storage regulator CsrA
LLLSRKKYDVIHLYSPTGERVEIIVMDLPAGVSVRLGLIAQKEYKIYRKEIDPYDDPAAWRAAFQRHEDAAPAGDEVSFSVKEKPGEPV